MFKYALIAILSFVLGGLLMHSCKPDKVEKLVINKTITDTLFKKVVVMQKAKEKVKLVSYTKLKIEVDTLHTIDTTARELVFKLLSEINKRDSIIAIDSIQVQALIKISDIQAEQLEKATEINETLTTEINKPKKALKYSLIANFVLLFGLIIRY
jgi:hypothetical protein